MTAAIGMPRGYRYRGTHAGKGWLADRIAALTWSNAGLSVAIVVGVLALPMVWGHLQDPAQASPALPTGPPKVYIAHDADPRGILAVGSTWAAFLEAAPCSPSKPEMRQVRNVRVTEAYVDSTEATVHYAGESFRTIAGPIKVRVTTWHLWHSLEWKGGAWRHIPLDGTKPVTAAEATAACVNQGAGNR